MKETEKLVQMVHGLMRGFTVKVVIIKSKVMRHLSPTKLHVAVLKKSTQKRHKQSKCDT
jgi:hypothetical protein